MYASDQFRDNLSNGNLPEPASSPPKGLVELLLAALNVNVDTAMPSVLKHV